ncbi:MAG: hypothetical protein JO097_01930 [Acidobacteriaceae bacterium]|nr:hypothetical protein [Acidobacteriaceae bacterium]MBV9154992.1 hypothetical protein [Acidobacteriaceae bacterium]MBV9764360.1 hypothetical protein [Acidobacteriaceae bacterium]
MKDVCFNDPDTLNRARWLTFTSNVRSAELLEHGRLEGAGQHWRFDSGSALRK